MDEASKAIESVKSQIDLKEKRQTISYSEFLESVCNEPKRVLRNIFQLFHDMVKSYVGEGEDENSNDPESIGFIKYDCSKIFVNGADNPFFADRLFANRFVRQAASLGHGSQQNRMNIYVGPHGCGKSTFLNNLLRTLEEYTDTKAGQSYELFWEINLEDIKISIPCNSHDHPILLIPKNYRGEFLKELLSGNAKDFYNLLLSKKEYEWILREETCTVCRSIFSALFDKVGSLEEVLGMVRVRPYKFDRRLGEGISVFNPGDRQAKETSFSDRDIQRRLDKLFGANIVKYFFSSQARTNNGVYVLMDIKSNNEARLLDLHNVISEGVHKVEDIEEHINSLFFALMNPEDKKLIESKAESFQARVQYNNIRYVMEVPTEVAIYRNTFGEQIEKSFLPKVLENFARVIISSRMNTKCEPLEAWIPNIGRDYGKYCDKYGLLLRMEIYGGVIPQWLSEEDKKKFTVQVRRMIVAEGENEGAKGFSGREAIAQFGEFFARHGGKPNLITMASVTDFFKRRIGNDERDKFVPKEFIDSLVNWYNYVVLDEVKKALYFYSTEQIKEDILNYLCAVNYEIGSKARCEMTGKDIEVTAELFKMMGAFFTGKSVEEKRALEYARDIQKKYVEIMAQNHDQPITETTLYQALFNSYTKNLKEKVLQPFIKNESFREAVKSYGTKEFDTYDTRMKEHITNMITNLQKADYNEQGAKEICLYVLDQKLAEKFS